MRLSLVAALLATLASTAPARAEVQYPWCAVYGGSMDGFDTTVCSFDTIEQCRATVSGLGGFCARNPMYPSAPPKGPRHPPRGR